MLNIDGEELQKRHFQRLLLVVLSLLLVLKMKFFHFFQVQEICRCPKYSCGRTVHINLQGGENIEKKKKKKKKKTFFSLPSLPSGIHRRKLQKTNKQNPPRPGRKARRRRTCWLSSLLFSSLPFFPLSSSLLPLIPPPSPLTFFLFRYLKLMWQGMYLRGCKKFWSWERHPIPCRLKR